MRSEGRLVTARVFTPATVAFQNFWVTWYVRSAVAAHAGRPPPPGAPPTNASAESTTAASPRRTNTPTGLTPVVSSKESLIFRHSRGTLSREHVYARRSP